MPDFLGRIDRSAVLRLELYSTQIRNLTKLFVNLQNSIKMGETNESYANYYKMWKNKSKQNELNQDHIIDKYTNWAMSYERDILSMGNGFKLPEMICQMIEEDWAPTEDERRKFRVLDVAAGTGLLGERLHCKHGFQNIDALDANAAMLNAAKDKRVYQGFIQARLGGGYTAERVCDGEYDIVVMSGAFAQGHLPIDALREIARMVRKGGYFFNSMTMEYLDTAPELKKLEPYVQLMEKEGVWKLIRRTVTGGHFDNKHALGHMCRIL